MPRIVLVHPYQPSMAPIETAFDRLWPAAQRLSILDETLYADVTADGVMAPDVPERIAFLFRHAARSGAHAIVFTGSTFGPAVDAARAGMEIPVLKADEAMALHAAEKGGSVLLVCTAARALPVLTGNLRHAESLTGKPLDISTLTVPEAKAALVEGNPSRHDDLIVAAIVQRPLPDTLMLGQMSMGNVPEKLPQPYRDAVVTSAEATVRHLRNMFGEQA